MILHGCKLFISGVRLIILSPTITYKLIKDLVEINVFCGFCRLGKQRFFLRWSVQGIEGLLYLLRRRHHLKLLKYLLYLCIVFEKRSIDLGFR